MVLRFAFDLGTGSIGMAVSHTDGHGALVPLFAGARILSARPDWQEARMGKRRKQARCRKRRKRRRRAFAALLRHAGLLPAPGTESDRLFCLDPYVLRAAGLDRAITLHAFGRVLMHLHKMRGRLLPGHLEPHPLPARTLGEMLARRHAGPVRSRKPVRNRLGALHADTLPEVSRLHIVRELETLWRAQQRFHAGILTEDLLEKVRTAFLDEGEAGRKAARTERRIAPVLAALGHCMAALEHRFGKPDAVVIEQALAPPAQRGIPAGMALPGWGMSLLRKAGLRPTRRRRLALALMERQERAAGGKALCPWSGKALTRDRLFSGAYEIDHVIPVSRGGTSLRKTSFSAMPRQTARKATGFPAKRPQAGCIPGGRTCAMSALPHRPHHRMTPHIAGARPWRGSSRLLEPVSRIAGRMRAWSGPRPSRWPPCGARSNANILILSSPSPCQTIAIMRLTPFWPCMSQAPGLFAHGKSCLSWNSRPSPMRRIPPDPQPAKCATEPLAPRTARP